MRHIGGYCLRQLRWRRLTFSLLCVVLLAARLVAAMPAFAALAPTPALLATPASHAVRLS